MAKFNNFKAFTGGVAEGLNNANARRDQERLELDKLKQQEMLKVDSANEIMQAKSKFDTMKQNQEAGLFSANSKSAAVQATTNALGVAQAPEASVSDATTPTVPPAAQSATGMPAGGSMPNITVNGQPPQASSAPAPTQGGLNSPQSSPVPITGSQPTQAPDQTAPQTPPSVAGTPPTTTAAVAPMDSFYSDANNQAAAFAYAKEKYKNEDITPALALGAKVEYYDKHQKDQAALEKEKAETTKTVSDNNDKVVNIKDLGDEDKAYVDMMKKNGIMGANTSQLHKPDARAEVSRDKVVTDAAATYAASNQAITSYNSLLGISGDVIQGPLSGLQAQINAGIDKLVADGEYEKRVNNTFVAMKDSTQLANANLKALGSTSRIGIGLASFEKSAVPGVEIPPEAMKTLIFQGLASARGAVNSSKAIISGPSQLEATDRLKVANAYAEHNPPLLPDGATPNPDFMDFDSYKKSVASGTFQSKLTGNQVRGEAINKNANPSNTPNTSAPADNAGWKYIGPVK